MPRFNWHDLVERFGEDDVYYNWLAYPNLHVASADGGYSFTIEHHIPVSPTHTEIEIYRFTARKRKKYAYSHQVLLSHMHGSKEVVGEDVKIMEMVQAGLHEGSPLAQQGEYEALNKIVERWYEIVMEANSDLL